MAKCKKGYGSCKNRPKMLVALVVGLAVLVLTPSVGGSTMKSVMSSVLVAQDGDYDQSGTWVESDGDGNYDTNDDWDNDGNSGGNYDTNDDWDNDGNSGGNYDTNDNWDSGGNYDTNDNWDNDGNSGGNYDTNDNWDNGGNSNWNEECYDGECGGDNWQQDTPTQQDCKPKIRDVKRMVREAQQILKKSEDSSGLESVISILEGYQTSLESCESLTWDDLMAIEEALYGENSINKQMEAARCEADFSRELQRLNKDSERMERDFERSTSHLKEVKEIAPSDMKSKIEDQLDRMERILELQKEMISFMENVDCSEMYGEGGWDLQEQLEDLRWEMDDIFFEMDDFWWEFETIQETLWANQMFDEIEREIEEAYQNEYPYLPPHLQAKFEEMAAAASELISLGREAQEAGDTERLKKIQFKLEELGRRAGSLMGAPEADFGELGFDEGMNDKFKDFSKDKNYGEAAEIIETLLALDPSLADKLMDFAPNMADKMFKIMGHVPEAMKGEHLNKLGELKDAYDNAVAVDATLASYEEEILEHQYFGDALDELVTNLGEVETGAMTASELAGEFDGLKAESKQSEVEEMGFFEDATTDTWYFEVAYEDAFNIQGKVVDGKKVFDAGGETTFAEMLKVVGESTGLGKADGSTSYSAAKDHWAEGYYKAAEEKGVTLMDPNHLITRGEMSKLMVEMMDLPVQNANTPFTDLSGNQHQDYVETLYSYDIIQGDPAGTVRPNDTINRAEAFTIAGNALEEASFATADFDDFKDLSDLEIDSSDVNEEHSSTDDFTENLMNNVMGAWKYVK